MNGDNIGSAVVTVWLVVLTCSAVQRVWWLMCLCLVPVVVLVVLAAGAVAADRWHGHREAVAAAAAVTAAMAAATAAAEAEWSELAALEELWALPPASVEHDTDGI